MLHVFDTLKKNNNENIQGMNRQLKDKCEKHQTSLVAQKECLIFCRQRAKKDQDHDQDSGVRAAKFQRKLIPKHVRSVMPRSVLLLWAGGGVNETRTLGIRIWAFQSSKIFEFRD